MQFFFVCMYVKYSDIMSLVHSPGNVILRRFHSVLYNNLQKKFLHQFYIIITQVSLFAFIFVIYIIFFTAIGGCAVSVANESKGIFFGIVTTRNSPLQNFIYDAWIRNLSLYSPESRVAFITKQKKRIPNVLYLQESEKYEYLKKLPGAHAKDRDIVIKRLIGAKYFIENTTLDWYWSISDDVLLIPDNILHVIKDLNSRFNTFTDSHLEGHCVYALDRVFLQGGAGYIFSRKAAELFIEKSIPFIINMTWYDDAEFAKMRDQIGVSIPQSASKFMVGHLFFEKMDENFYDTLDECPNPVPYTQCYGEKLFSIKHFTGYHSLKEGENHILPKLKKQLENIQKQRFIHPDISYYYDDFNIRFCKSKADHKVI